MKRRMLMLLVCTAAACKSDDRSAAGGGGSAQKPTKKVTAGKLTFADVLGDSKKPGLIGPFRAAKLGMTQDEVKAAVPLYAEKGDYMFADEVGVGMQAHFDSRTKRMSSLGIQLEPGNADAVAAAWGPPIMRSDGMKTFSMWLDPETSVRGEIDGEKKWLTIRRYIKTSDVLGEPGKPLAIEAAGPFLGATPDELRAAHGDAVDNVIENLVFMKWPQDEYEPGEGRFAAELSIDGGKVTRIQFWLHHGEDPEIKQKRLAELEAKYGPAEDVKDPYGKTVKQLSKSPKVIAGETKNKWVIHISEK